MTICDTSRRNIGTGIAGDYFGPNSVRAWWFSDSATNTAYSKNTETALLDNKFNPLAEITDGSELHAADDGAGGPARLVHQGRKATDDG